MKPLLEQIESPADLKSLTYEELDLLAFEIRRKIVETISENGGHLAPSLGAVELILAIHRVIDAPTDKLFFDVGHQAYAHKIITGRREAFDGVRKHGGISGFPKRGESEYDTYASGHASDSLSTAYGYAKARDLAGGTEKVVALIGDGSISGGLAFEAMNEMGQKKTPLVIVLNDNTMSISPNVGGLSLGLARARTNPIYQHATKRITEELSDGPTKKRFLDRGLRARAAVKSLVVPGMLFEEMGIKYLGPIDGHDIRTIEEALEVAFKAGEPVIIHAVTKKGKGYLPAEQHPDEFHGVGPFDRATGELVKKPGALPSYSKVFGDTLVNEVEQGVDAIAITAAMTDGTGLAEFAERFPERFVDVGIAEESAVTLASGIALAGKVPVVAIYSTFLQRAFDEIIINAALQNLHMVFCIDRAGIVGADGPTHNGAFDLAYLRLIPNMTIIAPSSARELRDALHTALRMDGPVAIRYPRGSADGDALGDPIVLEAGKGVVVKPVELAEPVTGKTVSILAVGKMVGPALTVAALLEEQGIGCSVADMRFVKPLDEDLVRDAAASDLIVTLEEGTEVAGFGSSVLEFYARESIAANTLVLGLPDAFLPQGTRDQVLADIALDEAGIAERIADRLFKDPRP